MIKGCGSVILTVMLFGGLAGAESYNYGSSRKEGEMRDQMKKELGLSKEQQKKLETHRIDQRAEMEKLMLDVRNKREELKTALENPEMDKRAVQRINEQLKDAQNEIADKRLEGILYVREVLTPDQFKKFLALRSEHSKRNERGNDRNEHRRNTNRTDSPSNHRHGDADDTHDSQDEDPMEMPNKR